MCFDVQEINNYLLKNKTRFYQEMGDKLKEIRISQNITINKLALKTFISNTYLTQIEKGQYGLSLIKFITICNSLGINPNYILRDFIITNRTDEDILIEKLQGSKNILINIVDFMKCK